MARVFGGSPGGWAAPLQFPSGVRAVPVGHPSGNRVPSVRIEDFRVGRKATRGANSPQGKWPQARPDRDSGLSLVARRGYIFCEFSEFLAVPNCLPSCLLVPLFLVLSLLSPRASEAFFVVEANSGRVLLSQGAEDRKQVASLTKVATAMVVLDWAKATNTDLGAILVVPPSVFHVGGSNPMGLYPGDRISIRNALYSALLGSDNSAAQSLAHHVGFAIQAARGRTGDPVKSFVKEMNTLAQALGMRRTRFVNPHGLDLPRARGYSTATDMARLCIYAMREPGFAFFVKQKNRKLSFEHENKTKSFSVQNTNQLLGQDNINGIKTGMTRLAGQCLATSSELQPLVQKLPEGRTRLTPRRLICVVLGSEDRFGRTKALVPRGWALYDQWLKEGAPMRDPARERLVVPNPR